MLLSGFNAVFGTPCTLDEIFAYQSVDASASTGWVIILCTLTNAFIA